LTIINIHSFFQHTFLLNFKEDPYPGTSTTANTVVTYGSQYGTLANPEREDWVFAGWYLNGTPVGSTTTVSMTIDHTLVAKWTKNISITYDGNGGKYIVDGQEKTIIESSPVAINSPETSISLTITSSTPTRTGYTFKGWSTSSAATQSMYNTGGIAILNDSITLYAVWEGTNTTVSFDARGGICGTGSKIVEYDKKYGELPTPVRIDTDGEAWEFLGWVNSSGTSITSSSTVSTTSNHTLYATWERKVKLTYVIEALSGNATVVEETINDLYTSAKSTCTFTLGSATVETYTFKGWSTSDNGIYVNYLTGDTVTLNKNLDLYAVLE